MTLCIVDFAMGNIFYVVKLTIFSFMVYESYVIFRKAFAILRLCKKNSPRGFLVLLRLYS